MSRGRVISCFYRWNWPLGETCFPQPASILGLKGQSQFTTQEILTQATQRSWLFSVSGIKTVMWVKKTTDLRWSPPPLKKKREECNFIRRHLIFLVRSQEGVLVFLTFSDEAQDKQVKTERAQTREKKDRKYSLESDIHSSANQHAKQFQQPGVSEPRMEPAARFRKRVQPKLWVYLLWFKVNSGFSVSES